MQIVARDAGEPQPAGRFARRACDGRGRRKQIPARMRRFNIREAGGRPTIDHMAAGFAGRGTDIDEPVGAPHHLQIVFDDKQRIARGLQALQRAEERFAIRGVQAGRWLVEYIHDAEQLRRQLRGESQALQFAG